MRMWEDPFPRISEAPSTPHMKNGSHMAEHRNGQAVSFSESAVPLIVKRGGITVQFNEGGVDVCTNLPVTVHPAASDSSKATTATPAELKPGDRIPGRSAGPC